MIHSRAPRACNGDPSSASTVCTMVEASRSLIEGFESLATKYDGFILDQYGVMHNGAVALPGAMECFSKLASAGKKLVVLSNTSRRARNAQDKLADLGFDTSLLSGFVTSGEETYKYIQERHQGQKCVFLTWHREGKENGESFLAGLDIAPAPLASANFILCHGTEVINIGEGEAETTAFVNTGDLSRYEPLLREAKGRDLEMLVANADFRALLPDGSLGYMPGSIGRAYEEMGGHVTWFGKPHARHFEACIRQMGVGESAVCHVGDSLEHDVAGANNARISSVLIAGGIHAALLGLEVSGDGVISPHSPPLSQDKVDTLIKQHGGTVPTWVCKQFVW